jgi:hypothetical protein
MVVTCCYLSPLPSLAETVAGRKPLQERDNFRQVDQLLSGMMYCATSDFGTTELIGGEWREKEVGCAN